MKKEELIDFLKWFMNYDEGCNQDIDYDYEVNNYLKSINNAHTESQTVRENEDKREKCPFCGSFIITKTFDKGNVNYTCYNEKCNAKWSF